MKKILLLSIVMFGIALLVRAGVTTLSWTSVDEWTAQDDAITYTTKEGYTLTASQAEGQSTPVVNAKTLDVRVYAKNELTVSAKGEAMTSIVFTLSDQGKRRLSEITASVGTVAIDTKAGTVTWTGSATAVTFTVGEKAIYGTDGETKAG